MKKALNVILQGEYPSLESFKKRLEDNGIYVQYFDGHKLETKNATFKMLDNRVLREPKEVEE